MATSAYTLMGSEFPPLPRTLPLARGDRVELRGFGAFSTRAHNERIGRNPRTREEVAVPRKAAPYFKTGKELRERLNRLH